MRPEPPTEEDLSQLAHHVNKLRSELRGADAHILAKHTGADYIVSDDKPGEFRMRLLGKEVSISFPDFIIKDQKTEQILPDSLQAIILYYFHTADEVQPTGTWISFSELPDGRFYNHAFQGYTGRKLAQSYHDDLTAFQLAASELDFLKESPWSQFPGDAAFEFQILPKVSLLVVFWQGDEDFPSSFQILFDASTHHLLPTYVCAIIGSMLTHKLTHNQRPST